MKTIKIGTRNSPLALWQANEVAAKLQALGHTTEIVPIISSGDKNLTQPLYAMGITGVFTKDLDIALLNKDIDIAVHSLKDVPTQLPTGTQICAVLERDFPQDVLVRKGDAKHKDLKDLKIATSSLRRRAFWAHVFHNTEFADIRGNVQTRLKKLEDGVADATLFSLAGLKRMELDVDVEEVDFLLQAPSQGVVCIANRTEDIDLTNVLKQINHDATQKCIHIEREFLRTLEGGCTAPIGAHAEFIGDKIRFQGRLCSLDGKDCINVDETIDWNPEQNFGAEIAQQVLERGGKDMMLLIKSQIKL